MSENKTNADLGDSDPGVVAAFKCSRPSYEGTAYILKTLWLRVAK
ncbi:hypothetical protein [Pseudovibrio ascidiaceicola]|nr:hypothetical protein [Pseudovibrio ascidiaceicola]